MSPFRNLAAINNPDQSASQAAAWLQDCAHGRLNVRAKGRKGAFPQGIYLDGDNNDSLVMEVGGFDPSAIVGGTSNRVVNNQHILTAPGQYDSLEIRGI